jgi:hypothetical protein
MNWFFSNAAYLLEINRSIEEKIQLHKKV